MRTRSHGHWVLILVAAGLWGCAPQEDSGETGAESRESGSIEVAQGAGQVPAGTADGSAPEDELPTDTPVPSEQNGNATDGQQPGEASAGVTLRPVDKAEFNEVLKKHDGQVVLVDFWGTWCVPCRKGFPHTVQLSHKYADEGLRVVSVAIEFEPNRQAVLEFLQKQEATFDNLLSEHVDADAFDAFEVTSLPEYRIYGRDGKLVRRFRNDDNLDPETAWNHEDIEAAVREALGITDDSES